MVWAANATNAGTQPSLATVHASMYLVHRGIQGAIRLSVFLGAFRSAVSPRPPPRACMYLVRGLPPAEWLLSSSSP